MTTIPNTPAPPPELCPDCQRPRPKYYWEDDDEFCFATGTIASCMPKTVARLRLELSKAQGELHEAWRDGYSSAVSGLFYENPFPKPEKKESPDANG